MSEIAKKAPAKLVDWIDLSAYNARLNALKFPDGRIRVVLQGLEPGSGDWNWVMSTLGFSASKSNTFLFREGSTIQLGLFAQRFPRAKRVKLPPNRITQLVTLDNRKSKRVDIDARAADVLGLNYRGQTVCAGVGGRYIQDGASQYLSESESRNPALFLRAVTDADLALCADGFVERMVRGEMMYSEDMVRFAGIVYGEDKPMEAHDARLRGVQEAIEAAMQRRLERDVSEPDPTAFGMAVALMERQPTFVFRTSSSIENQQYSTPLPMAIAAQFMLDAKADERILEPTIGNGSLVSKLPSGVSITGVEIDPRRAGQVTQLREDIAVITGDFTRQGFTEKFDRVIGNPPFGGLSSPQEIDGLRVTRIDQLILMRSLLARKPEGRSVYIIAADRENMFSKHAGEIKGGSKYLFNWLADHYELESVVELDGKLYEKQGAGYPVRMVVVGPRRSEAEIAQAMKTGEHRIKDRLKVIHSWEGLWAHAEEAVILHRNNEAARLAKKAIEEAAKQDAEYYEPVVPESIPEAGEGSAQAEEELFHENTYQAPYIPASKISEPSAMVPRNLVAPIASALDEMEFEYGSIDEYVAKKLQYPIDDLPKYFNAEQVDAIALAIAATDKNRALINADQTGQGKGRVAAAMVRYSILKGIPAVFLSEKDNLFSDLYRDMNDIGSADLLVPFVINSGVDIRNDRNERVFSPTKAQDVNRLMDEHMSPAEEGANAIFCTYSQLNRDAAGSKKAHWFVNAVAKNAFLVLDESHNAAGESNTGTNIAEAIANARYALYSSATYAKNAKNMQAYAKAFPPGVCDENLARTLEVGGEPLQEILSGMLAADGVFIRREHDLSKLEFVMHEDIEHKARNEDLSDQLSEILLAMSYLSGDVDSLVSKLQKEIKTKLKGLSAEQRKGNRMQVSRANFGSRLYAIQRQFMLAIKVDETVRMASKALEGGRKPVIVLENTQETLVKDVIASMLAAESDGEEVSEAAIQAVLGSGKDIPAVTFRDVLYRVLDKLDVIVERNAYGTVEKTTAIAKAENEEQAKAWEDSKKAIRSMIERFPDLPCSPIDIIRSKLEALGHTCGELSGRGMVLGVRPDGTMSVMPRVDDRIRTIYDFNMGGLDAIILSKAGSTGISLHASEKFDDQRRREMIELQIPNNVNERVQFFGRVNRRGQVNAPLIRTIGSGLPGEQRVLAMQNAKLRKLSANTSSNRSNAAENREVLDVINPVGNSICEKYLENNPALAKMLGIDLDIEESSQDECYFANKLFGRISLLRIGEQKRILNEVALEYEATMKELDRRGINPFRANEYDWKAEVVEREVFHGAECDTYDSVFDHPVYLAKLQWEEDRNPLRWETVQGYQERAIARLLDDPRCERVEYLNRNSWGTRHVDFGKLQNLVCAIYEGGIDADGVERRGLLEKALPDKFESVRLALADSEDNAVKRMHGRYTFLNKTLDWLSPGMQIRFSDEGDELIAGLLVDVVLPPPGREYLLGQYQVRIAVPGQDKLMEISLSRLMECNMARTMNLEAGQDRYTADPSERIARRFDEAPSGKVLCHRYVLEGNLFKAAQLAAENNFGMAGIYTDKDGIRRRAVIAWRRVEMEDLMSAPQKIERATVATEMVRTYPIAYYTASKSDDKSALKVMCDGARLVLRCSGSRVNGGKWFGAKSLIDLVGEFAGNRDYMQAACPIEKAPEVIDTIYRLGGSLYVPPSKRDEYVVLSRQVDEREKRERAELLAAAKALEAARQSQPEPA